MEDNTILYSFLSHLETYDTFTVNFQSVETRERKFALFIQISAQTKDLTRDLKHHNQVLYPLFYTAVNAKNILVCLKE